jgi:hypothetical protein
VCGTRAEVHVIAVRQNAVVFVAVSHDGAVGQDMFVLVAVAMAVVMLVSVAVAFDLRFSAAAAARRTHDVLPDR